ncbi:uncharacterized protein [Nerophis lumbriciformis]|uniref:uncharacterized protein isoform X2 n=1 Tax=Nerophis lumbriciformis TaxID=546530 RepID=UPI002ADFDDB8|nr:uncharacterized protein LOC133582863 isoform X2 [Nerophis lumbriciformis]
MFLQLPHSVSFTLQAAHRENTFLLFLLLLDKLLHPSISTASSLLCSQVPNMDSQSPQLLLVAPNDTRRLLEVYVKRSLSFDDGSLDTKPCERQAKWVTLSKRHRRHSSDPFLHSTEGLNDHVFSTEPLDRPETQPDDKLSKKSRKNKKPSLWKTFIGLFSRRTIEDKDEDALDIPEASSVDEDLTIATACLPASPPLQRKKSSRRRSIKRRFSKRRLSLIQFSREEPNPADITGVEAVVSVEPTYSYYEKVSEELEKILNEVKENEEVVTLSDDKRQRSPEEILPRDVLLLLPEVGRRLPGEGGLAPPHPHVRPANGAGAGPAGLHPGLHRPHRRTLSAEHRTHHRARGPLPAGQI